MTAPTPPALRVLHAVRTLGFAGADRIAAQVDLPEEQVLGHLLDDQAAGHVARSAFAGSDGWSLTEEGRRHGERMLAAELDAVDARDVVEDVHRDFLPLNAEVSRACTAWQLAELGIGATSPPIEATVATLTRAAEALAELERRLTSHLLRFAGYHRRFADALRRAADDPAWITATDRDSCHLVWFQLHEDLIATLGLTR
ncbi:hypothetical protein [Euzebya sp.]|uniref:hypothetical protein n=1 Tax=Euzebya sp. TaxID=1971409 RepID=UPI0035132852